jgi:rhamnosyltransferase subunit B
VVAELLGIPWVAVTMAPISFFSRHDPPVLMATPWLERLAAFSKPLYAGIVRFAQRTTRDWGAPVFQLREDLGLGRGLEPMFEARRNADAILAMFSAVVGKPQIDWPTNARITGFAFYDHHEPMPDALSEFLASGSPPIVFTLGSAAVFDPGTFYRESTEAAARLGRRAVLLVGPDPARVSVPSDTRTVASYAPYSALFPRAAAIVHQGGIGTTAQALRAGRPMLIVPFSHDQPDNAARMVRLGVARTIRRGNYSAQTAAAALDRLLSDPSYEQRAADASVAVRHEDGAARAADVIESIVRRS